MSRTRALAGAAAVVVVAVVLVVAIAARPAGRHDRGGPSTGATTTARAGSVPAGSLPPEPGSARCEALRLAFRPELRRRGVRFVDLVRAAPDDRQVAGVGSSLVLVQGTLHPDFGSWGPAVDFLVAEARHRVLGVGELPKLDDDVLASAAQVDRDLTAGVCG